MSAIGAIRAPLFAPANRPERFVKAAASGADAVILDLEDAVPRDAKAVARSAISAAFTDLPVIVRINGLSDPAHHEDVEAVCARDVGAVMIPKAEASPDFVALCVDLANAGRPAIALIESARGLASARELALLPNVVRLAFGSIDFAADVGCAHVRDALLLARLEIVLASRLAQKPAPIDGVTTSVDNEALIRDDAAYARRLGFGAKLTIHPRQIGAIREAFSPTEEEIAWAKRVLDSGDGAVKLNGEMVDAPVRARARAIVSAL